MVIRKHQDMTMQDCLSVCYFFSSPNYFKLSLKIESNSGFIWYLTFFKDQFLLFFSRFAYVSLLICVFVDSSKVFINILAIFFIRISYEKKNNGNARIQHYVKTPAETNNIELRKRRDHMYCYYQQSSQCSNVICFCHLLRIRVHYIFVTKYAMRKRCF